ncbi:MAG TPA: hypothetical protein VHV50_07890 [Actinomycetota bacterium]|nr:hypothetical protein [Actinomycetota bacterium]
MNEEERDEEQSSPRRPRVVDKRISARSAAETTSGPPPAEPAPTETRSPAGPPPDPPATSREPAPAHAVTEPATPPPPAGEGPQVWTPEQEAEAARMAQEIADTPSLEWVVNTAVTLANVAATKLELGTGADAQLAIDALAGLVNSVGPKLQQAEAPLRQTLAQLQLAYAQRLAPPPA